MEVFGRSRTQSTMALDAAVDTAKNPSEETLLRRNRFLMVTVVVLVAVLIILTILFAVEKHAKDRELTEMEERIGGSHKTVTDVSSNFDFTMRQLRKQMENAIDAEVSAKEADLKGRTEQLLEKSRQALEQQMATEMKAKHQQIDSVLKNTDSTLIELVKQSGHDVRTACFRIAKMAKQSVSKINALVNQTRSLLETQLNQNVVTFRLGSLFKNFNTTNNNLFSEPQEELIDGVSLVLKMNLHYFGQPALDLYIDCYKDTNTASKETVRKSMQLTVLTNDNEVFSNNVHPPLPIPSCSSQHKPLHYRQIGHVEDLRAGSALVDDSIRIALKFTGEPTSDELKDEFTKAL